MFEIPWLVLPLNQQELNLFYSPHLVIEAKNWWNQWCKRRHSWSKTRNNSFTLVLAQILHKCDWGISASSMIRKQTACCHFSHPSQRIITPSSWIFLTNQRCQMRSPTQLTPQGHETSNSSSVWSIKSGWVGWYVERGVWEIFELLIVIPWEGWAFSLDLERQKIHFILHIF